MFYNRTWHDGNDRDLHSVHFVCIEVCVPCFFSLALATVAAYDVKLAPLRAAYAPSVKFCILQVPDNSFHLVSEVMQSFVLF